MVEGPVTTPAAAAAPQTVPPVPPLDRAAIIAEELRLPANNVATVLGLVAEGATVPFMARYRKEATGGMDEVQIAAVKDRAEELQELEARRKTVLDSIASQGKLTDSLFQRIVGTLSKTELEDLYLPYKPKRRTRAMIARERGLEPLAELLWAQEERPAGDRTALAQAYVSAEKEVPDVEAAWAGARDIVAERIAESADARAALRQLALSAGAMKSQMVGTGNEPERMKFQDYFDFEEPAAKLPSHRILALRRGEKEGFLRLELSVDRDSALSSLRGLYSKPKAAFAKDFDAALVDAHDRLLRASIELDVRLALKERADAEAIRVFAENLRHLLLASPLGGKRVLALDPGFRTGCKVVVLDDTGKLLENGVVYPHEPQRQVDATKRELALKVARHKIEAIAIGNGTAGRETEALVRAMKKEGLVPATLTIVSVNESGASVYSASEIAREEFPDEDITVRGAVSIGRRLQDPLAELVKIDPKSIGVGQYQHDVNQSLLEKALDGVVASCVNAVGVEVNTASAKLLSYVSGIGPTLAKNIVEHRAQNGPFRSRKDLRSVARLGPKAFEQAAGFLRVAAAENPLDRSAVHPESYDVVEKMARDLDVPVARLVGNAELARRIDIKKYVDGTRGEPTLRDIVSELEKPGRDPRQSFEESRFREDVTEIAHLKEDMVLEGIVTNVTAFGAFVDVGVHQDGLVHVSELAHKFVKDPAEVVKVGDRVKVRVLKVELDRKRIALSIKQASAPENSNQGARGNSSGAPQVGGARPSTDRSRSGVGGGPRQTPPQQPRNSPFNSIRWKS
ncbi:MAG TPA: Tex family protein [Polyangia bacterium]